MFTKTQILAFALSLASAEAASKGFNYGNNKPDGSLKAQADFQSEFQTAKNLEGTSGFNSARLYTMIQGEGNSPIEAIPAAIAEETSLLLGLWASGGNMDNEITALKSAIEQYGDSFTKLVVGISVGSEDLYRNSEIGVKANAGIGTEPEELIGYIKRVREAISGTSLSDAPVGHVDTWNSWTNGSNSAVIEEVDWLGFDGYPYFQSEMENSIDNAKNLWNDAVGKTKGVANGKPVWITEGGWPVSGDQQNLAVASIENAKRFWDEVGCPLFDEVNTWWYILQDAAGSSTPNPSFGIVGNSLTTKPLYDLSCKGKSSTGGGASTGRQTSSGASSGANSGANSGSSSGASSSGASSGGSLGSSGSFGGSGVGASSSSIVISPSGSATATPSSSAGAGSSGSSGSGAGATGSGAGSGSGTSDQSSPSPSPSEFTGAGARLSGSIFGAAVLVAALAVAL
ncbi:hypothetical protein ASPVEDRAFT_139284 [Aspergillus versicolor CBS 583.65]|uniref:Probable glucan endo-1,3-beta-glucosidase eglC n=1 Tax=Aspergillus versicolor CBS 583.65 TaxID=1036611 RepID=A0A1L9PWX2_ASPVE|nr:uncharacterized protein ASPVEDRAFT_139284 [Aspergillus versicolor CBS 583.65]OJJ06039.1 hypothetical protein ASPVEDRAFT_139284 [Aspergillus versicolor CBS 583.65]